MNNIDQKINRLNKHRYSIQHLLALSGTAYLHFDLSKFSFDAARAGVIPSLGDCATSSRRSSTTKVHGSSSESSNTVDENMVSIAQEAQVLQRRPQPPPASDLAQQHAGFARFLKKHTSPTHQRVTAGGRIVPMEAQRPPPTFLLTKSDKSDSTDAFYGIEHHELQARKATTSAGYKSLDMTADPEAHVLNTMKRSENASYGFSMFTSNGWPVPQVNTVYPHLTQNDGMSNVCPPLPVMDPSSVPFTGLMPGNNTTYSFWPNLCAAPSPMLYPAMCPWQYQNTTTHFAMQPQANYPNHLNTSIMWARDALSDWTQRYNDLEQQLKTLDRHRAMTSLTPDIASQRREIVQQRSDSKNMMNQITEWLKMSEQVHPDIATHSSGLGFNADARPYVPAQQAYAESSSKVGVKDSEVTTNESMKPPVRSNRRPIAIVPPPKSPKSESLTKGRGTSPSSSPNPEKVDSWGVKLGPAPPELRRQQSEILESMSEAQNNSPSSSQSQESLQPVPQGGFFSQGSPETARPDSFGHPSAQGELKHAISVNEQSADQALYAKKQQIPQSSNNIDVSHFEDSLWFAGLSPDTHASQKQVHGLKSERRLLTTPVNQGCDVSDQNFSASHHSGTGNGKENISVTPTAHRKAATDLFLARFNLSESCDDMAPYQEMRSPEMCTSLEQLPAKEITQPRRIRLSPVKLIQRYGGLFQNGIVGRTTCVTTDVPTEHSQVSEQNPCSRSWNMARDARNKKGHTSTSVQSVNAVAQLPHDFDGAGDNVRSSRSIFSLVGKVKSPRILYRSTVSDTTRPGPHYREVLERALVCDSESSPRSSPKRVPA